MDHNSTGDAGTHVSNVLQTKGVVMIDRCNSIISSCRNTGLFLAALLSICAVSARSQAVKGADSYVSEKQTKGVFTVSASGRSSPLWVSSQDYPGVKRIAGHLQEDISRVSGARPDLTVDRIPAGREIVLVGTLGKSPLIDQLISQKKLDVSGVEGKWEVSLIQVVENPFPGVDRALVIAGSDKRGTIFGMYDLSSKIGVSPWYWWADVPAMKKTNIYVLPGRHSQGEPAVRYRGIFINDEQPALGGWVYEKFGGFNHSFYEKVFELILRLKGNFLWPAMWGRMLYVDDPVNPQLADEYGVVIGTSHHEPMMRAHAEWGKGPGTWNYQTNEAALKDFWKQGIKRMGSYESVVTLGMRGDGDEPMSEDANIALLERIVKDQRQILGEVTGKDVTTIPQMWALYKEVQEYYDKGMRVPDDVTLMLCDDNWGNIRKLPKLTDKPRTGGYGIYYHFDYVGGPRNYKWLNTNQISRVWEQMHLAYEYGARQIWIVNVGDIKPMEFPISFFLDYAWNPGKWPAERLPEYTRLWAKRQFGKEHDSEIAQILTSYTKFNSRRKPELLSPETYSLVNYREAETVVSEYRALEQKALGIRKSLPSEYDAAYYQLVLHPVEASANLNDLYVTVGRNWLYASQGRAATNSLAKRAKELYARDSAITYYYNNVLAGGKWSHMMDQTHIGYTYWQQPDQNSMPEVKEIMISVAAEMGVAPEGTDRWWPNEGGEAILPEFDSFNRQKHTIELFNRGKTSFRYSVRTDGNWVQVTPPQGTVEEERRLWVSVDWTKAPGGTQKVPITILGPGNNRVVVFAVVKNIPFPKPDQLRGFVESNGYVSVEAEHYTRAVPPRAWLHIPDLGRTLSAMTFVPVTSAAQLPGGNAPHLEYQIEFFSAGEVEVKAYLSPTLNFHNTQGLRYAVSFDDDKPQIVNFNSDNSTRTWEQWVANNINVTSSKHNLAASGRRVLKFWVVDPGVVLQRLVVETAGAKPSYLGPPESFHR